MDNYIIKFFDGETVEITQDDFENIAGKTGMIVIKSIGEVVNTSSIARIIPKSQFTDKSNENEGVLHDGTQVVKYFGTWMVANEPDENGKPCVRIDPEYYPEVARDCVPSKSFYNENLVQLPLEERKIAILEGTVAPRLGNGGFQKI